MHYLITGHTGFKGSWLVLMLNQLGHEVSGISLDPAKKSLFKTAKISKKMSFDEMCDIRDVKKLNKKIQKISPDVVIHLAAQPLVRKSYADPRETIETNAIGTFNVLEAVSKTPLVAEHSTNTTKVHSAEAFDEAKANKAYQLYMADVDEVQQQDIILDDRLRPNSSMDAFR